tara:strand:+ start:103148 stop:103936 length:789 start_codon:yes stop_codon:yes gene_type:complete
MGAPFDLTDLIINFMLPFIRIAALFMVMPIFGASLIPKRVKVILSLGVSFIVFVSLSDSVVSFTQSLTLFHLVLLIGQQILIGAAMGLIIHIIFQAFVIAGQISAMQMGLGFASMMDPQNGVSVPAVGQLYLMIVTLLYLSINGHLYAIQILVESFAVFPVTILNITSLPVEKLILLSNWMFMGAVKISLPAIAALLIVNLSIGIMTKAAPQLNIFSIGFPLTMILGLIILWFAMAAVVPEFHRLMDAVHFELVDWGTPDVR